MTIVSIRHGQALNIRILQCSEHQTVLDVISW